MPWQHYHCGADLRVERAPRPRQKIRACRYLSKSGDVMLDHECVVIAGAFAFHVGCGEVLEAVSTICINPAALHLGAAKKAEFRGV